MTEQPTKVKAWIDKERYIEFTDVEDLLVFTACTGGYVHFSSAYRQVKGGKATTKEFKFYRAKQQRFGEILSTARLNDGTSLFDAIKQKVML